MNRTAPDMPCDVLFEPREWKSVYRVVMKKPLPPQVPTLNEFMKLLTSLGGYNNRANDAPSGPQTLWIGIRRMLDYS